jgi:hypothetical protein
MTEEFKVNKVKPIRDNLFTGYSDVIHTFLKQEKIRIGDLTPTRIKFKQFSTGRP